MSLLPAMIAWIDSSNMRRRPLSKPPRRGLGFERLETRLTLSAATGIALEPTFISLPTIQGETVSVSDTFRERFTGGFFFDADNRASFVVSGSLEYTWNGSADGFLFAGSLTDSTLDAGWDSNTLLNGSSNGSGQIAIIRPPDPTPARQPDGGMIAISELFIPPPRSQAGPTATDAAVFRSTTNGPNLGRTPFPARAQNFPAAQGREMAFEVAVTGPKQTAPTFHAVSSVGPSLGSSHVPANLLSRQDVVVGPRRDDPLLPPDSSTMRARGATSPRAEVSHLPDGSFKLKSTGGPLEADQPVGPSPHKYSPHKQSAPADAAGSPLRLAAPRFMATQPSAREQVFADWQSAQSQAVQTRKQDDRIHAWEIFAVLAGGGWIIRGPCLPAENKDRQEPPRRKK